MPTVIAEPTRISLPTHVSTLSWCRECAVIRDSEAVRGELQPRCPACNSTLEFSTTAETTWPWGHVID